MVELQGLHPFGGLFVRLRSDGRARLARHPEPPASLSDPKTGRPLKIATVEVADAICPSCSQPAEGGFVSFVADLRMVYACPACDSLVWTLGV